LALAAIPTPALSTTIRASDIFRKAKEKLFSAPAPKVNAEANAYANTPKADARAFQQNSLSAPG